jgi:hypothetical protein
MTIEAHRKPPQTTANHRKFRLIAGALSILVFLPTIGIAATQCFYDIGDETLASTYDGYAQYYDPGLNADQYSTVSDYNYSYPRPPSPCVEKSSTLLSRGPVQVQFGDAIVEVSFYDRVTQLLGPSDKCAFPERSNRWKFSGTNVLRGSSGLFCLSQIDQAKTLSLTVLSPVAKEIRPAGTTGNSVAELIAKVADGTTPKAGVAVSFTADVAAKSGGHDHGEASRPKGKLSLAQGTTDANGEVKVTFTAPQIAGIHTIKATCVNCTNSPASAEIKVKVPDLLNIFTLPFRDPNWAYPGVGKTDEHADNHYLTVAAAARMLDISRKYQKIWPTAPKLTLNDASLVWGGKFDIKGTWERNPKAHAEHRIGDNIDIRANNASGAVPANIRGVVFRWLRNTSRPADNIPADFVIDTVDPLHESIGDINEHFHLRLGK